MKSEPVISIDTDMLNRSANKSDSERYLPVENRIPGNQAVWVGIFSEMSEFVLIFIVYFLAKVHHAELFNEGPFKVKYSGRGVQYIDTSYQQLFRSQCDACYTA